MMEVIVLAQYKIPWAFYMKYNLRQKTMTIHLSKDMMTKCELPLEMLNLDDTEIKEFIHRYDYRKLDYFSTHPIQGIFDTTFSLKTTHGKNYLKTKAICQKTTYGISCLLIEDIHIHKMKVSFKQLSKTEQLQIVFSETEQIELLETNTQWIKIRNHVSQIITRPTI